MFRFCRFRSIILPFLAFFISVSAAAAAPRNHVVAFGKWNSVHCAPDPIIATDGSSLTLKVRPLLVDGRVKEFTFGVTHDVTDRLFVVRRAFRVNDSLPQESSSTPHWEWQQGGWLLVDRATGRISTINLPEFDPGYSTVSWYRDYAAYCGISDDGKQIFAIVAQINRRKPVVKWLAGEAKFTVEAQEWKIPESACRLPDWQRSPARVTFEPNPSTKRTYVIRNHAVDLLTGEDNGEEATN